MKGLLLKDFYQYKQYCKMFFLGMIPFFIVLGTFLVNEGSIFLLFYPAMLMGMMPMTIMAYEEKDKWDVYSRLLPYRLSWLVSIKYLTILLMNLILLIVMMGLILLREWIGLPWERVTDYSFWGIVIILISAGLLGPALLYPFCFRNGVEKARMIRMVYIFIYCIAGGIGGGLIEYTEGSSRQLWNQSAGTALLGGFSVILFLLSWVLSIKWYREREF